MGSAKVSIVKPQTMEKKSFKPISLIRSFFDKSKKKEKAKEKELAEKQNEKKDTKAAIEKPETIVASILEPFKELNIKTKNETTIKTETKVESDRNIKTTKETNKEDELDNFTINVIEEDRRSNRIYSQSSEDSGYADHDVRESLQNLTLDDKECEGDDKECEGDDKETKDKKTRQVLLKRTPMRIKVSDHNAHPYTRTAESASQPQPINQINQQTLSGGQVIVNSTTSEDLELDVALESVANIYMSNPSYWSTLLDKASENNLSEFPQINDQQNHTIDIVPKEVLVPNPIEEFSETHVPSFDESIDFTNSDLFFGGVSQNDSLGMFPTPPRSENVPSPLSESQAFYPSNSEYTLSPERSSPINSYFERYQEISPLSNESFEDKNVDRASQTSQSSMTMKNFKDLQKEIANEFSKKECCDINRKSSKEIFEEHMQKLQKEERKNLCLSVSKIDTKAAYGILHNILLTLSKECTDENLQYTLFALVCQRVLAQTPALFLGDFGLSILKAAALRCPDRPLLTRHIVHCVYLVLRSDPNLRAKECVFHEVDAQGDNLLIACARGGDSYANVLNELTRKDASQDLPPLFKLHHANADGYTALQLACREHSASNSRLHTVHVLLDHANADIWKGDIKGGDTALHLAVNSSTCCLQLVMLLFKHEDRKQWKKLAHAPNMSSTTPIEYARLAVKSTTRKNYPHEVLNFLKKCR